LPQPLSNSACAAATRACSDVPFPGYPRHAATGNLDIAGRAMALVRALDPNLRLHNVKDRLPHRQPELITRWEDALRKAGLPE
jgi:hypothetical protein